MKKFRNIAIVVLLVLAVAYKLFSNRKQIEAEASTSGSVVTEVPVSIAPAKLGQLSENFTLNGVFESVSEVSVVSEGQGNIVNVQVNTGDKVSEGQVLVCLDDVLVKAQFELADAAFQKAKRDYEKFEGLAQGDAISAQQFEEIKLAYKNAQTNLTVARKQLDNAKVKAPFSGLVTKRYVEKGGFLSPGMPVVDLIKIGNMKLIVELSEPELQKVKPGQDVSIKISTIENKIFNGRVANISSKAGNTKRYTAEVEVENKDAEIKSGMFGTVSFSYNKSKEVLLIPRSSIIGSLKMPEVFVVNNGVAYRRLLTVGEASDESVVVTSGLNANEMVVTNGQINLGDTTRVIVVK